MKCASCDREVREEDAEKLALNEAQKQYMRLSLGPNGAVDVLFYCRPCWRILQDPLKGASLIRGMLEIELRQSGDTNAAGKADRLFKFLVEKAAKGGMS